MSAQENEQNNDLRNPRVGIPDEATSAKSPEEIYEKLRADFDEETILQYFDPEKEAEKIEDPKKKPAGDPPYFCCPGSHCAGL